MRPRPLYAWWSYAPKRLSLDDLFDFDGEAGVVAQEPLIGDRADGGVLPAHALADVEQLGQLPGHRVRTVLRAVEDRRVAQHGHDRVDDRREEHVLERVDGRAEPDDPGVHAVREALLAAGGQVARLGPGDGHPLLVAAGAPDVDPCRVVQV